MRAVRDVRCVHHYYCQEKLDNVPPGVWPWVTGALGQSDPSNQGISGEGMFQFSDKQVRLEKLVTPGEIITMLDPTSH